MKTCKSLLFIVSIFSHHLFCQFSNQIRLNQIGFYPTASKKAIVQNVGNTYFYLVNGKDTVFKGKLSALKRWEYSNERVSIADFSEMKKCGKYQLVVPNVGYSFVFEIQNHALENIARASLKAFYYQRASVELPPHYAEKWARPAGHPDTNVIVHPSAASYYRPAGTIISSPGGWYDAGDYNKYIVNSGISTYTLLATYEYFPEYCRKMNITIPESENVLPDILDEALWNIRWMLTMQDPYDGGVYHKLTNAVFDPYIMPHEATTPRYVVMKSTAATLNFAAVMAQISRIARQYDAELPGFADTCLDAALKAWNWARQNPNVYYIQTLLNSRYEPAIRTGEYGDTNVADEFAWAAAELFVTTKQDSFLYIANPLNEKKLILQSWSDVNMLGLITLARYHKEVTGIIDTIVLKGRILTFANTLVKNKMNSAYDIVMGINKQDFIWGSNAIAANQSMLLLVAFYLTGEYQYLDAALSNVDYLFGRNPLSLCFVTGFGERSPKNIHHRISAADGIDEPVPGFLVGGPNIGRQDRLQYPSPLPALMYIDDVESYASNEICINWNAPLVFITIGLETFMQND